jgi:hypothetical protein
MQVAELKAEKNQALKKKYSSFSRECMLNDKARVIKLLMARLHKIHRPAVIHVENHMMDSVNFFEGYFTVSYEFKLYTQRRFGSKLGTKSEPMTLESTKGIDVNAYGASTALAKCLIDK